MKTGRGATITGGAATTGAGTGTRTHPAKLVATAATNSSEAANRPNVMRAMSHPPAELDEAGRDDVSSRQPAADGSQSAGDQGRSRAIRIKLTAGECSSGRHSPVGPKPHRSYSAT